MSSERTPTEQVILDRAKAKLMKVLKWDEPMAHYSLIRLAMERHEKKVQFAHAVLAMGKRQLKELTCSLGWVPTLATLQRTPSS